jgi:hypothetical protein
MLLRALHPIHFRKHFNSGLGELILVGRNATMEAAGRIPSLRRATVLLTFLIFISAMMRYEVTSVCAQQASGSYSYTFDVDADGNTEVTIVFSAVSFDRSWVIIPTNTTEWSLRTQGILLTKLTPWVPSDGEPSIFYQNLSFSYRAPARLEVIYNMTHGGLIYEPDAFFLSPQIGFDDRFPAQATVLLRSATAYSNLDPIPTSVDLTPQYAKFSYGEISSDARIAIQYKVSGTVRLQTLVNGSFTGITPTRYLKEMKHVIDVYSQVYPQMISEFGTNLSGTTVRFFVPGFDEIGLGGYTPFTARGLGDIYLNIFYVRFVSGYFEAIAIHELTHHFLWSAGIPPDILWIHEGMANYFGIEYALRLNYSGARGMQQDLIYVGDRLGTYLGFVENWTPSTQVADTQAYYAASYRIVRTLAAEYGGFEFYGRFFREIAGESGLDNAKIVEALSRAAGRDLKPEFYQWGFSLVGTELPTNPLELMQNLLLLLGALLVLAVIVAVASAARRRPRAAELPKLYFCPQCGRPLAYINEYGLYYCYSCQRYVDLE